MHIHVRIALPKYKRFGLLVSIAVGLAVLVPSTAMGALTIARESLSAAGAQGDGDSSQGRISRDGRYSVFCSDSSQLVPGDTNGKSDVFLRDRQTGSIQRMSVSRTGVQGNGDSFDCSLSADGRNIAFASVSDNLVPNDANGGADVFVCARTAGDSNYVQLISAGCYGGDPRTANGDSDRPVISADGAWVAFRSAATDLLSDKDKNGQDDIFIRNTWNGAMKCVSVSTDGARANDDSDRPSLSPDGRYVVYESDASNLAGGDTNFSTDVFIRDTVGATTERISVSTLGVEGNDGSYDPAVSRDGRFVTYSTDASNLVSGDVNGFSDILIRDRVLNTTALVNRVSGGLANADSESPAISDDGAFVAFESRASNLVTGDTNSATDVFVARVSDGLTDRVSGTAAGVQGNGASVDPGMSGDGRYVAYSSAAANLFAGDTNGKSDVFAAARVVMKTRVFRQPGATKTYRRRRGTAKYALTAIVGNEIGVPVQGARVYLQKYDARKRSWRKYRTLTTGNAGTASATFKSKGTSTAYYRWYVPAASDHTKCYTTKQTIRVK